MICRLGVSESQISVSARSLPFFQSCSSGSQITLMSTSWFVLRAALVLLVISTFGLCIDRVVVHLVYKARSATGESIPLPSTSSLKAF